MMRGLARREPNTGTMEIPRDPGAQLYWLEIGERDRSRVITVADGSRLVLGSKPHSDVVLRDPTVSGKHCLLTCEEGRLHVEDLDSRNGLFVGNARVQKAELDSGSVFIVGRVSIIVGKGEGPAVTCPAEPPIPGMVGTSASMLRLARDVRRMAGLSFPVVIRGETGTGKELVARALHDLGPRAAGPFVAVNAAALPNELAEAELFGHERGAFTGAHMRRLGAFLEAQGGTLFLDEVGELGREVQVKLLRVLEQREVRPLGSASTINIDVRVVTATWAPLERMVEEGRFREDLYHRLAVASVQVPPLAERKTDIPELAEFFLREREAEVGHRVLSPAAVASLVAERWSGNVRQLRNVITRAAFIASGEVIGPNDIARALRDQPTIKMRMPRASALALLATCEGKVAAAARRCGVPRSTFRGWLGT